MTFHAPTGKFTVNADELARAANSLLWAISQLRRASNLDLKGYTITGPMENPHFAESGILDAASELGIDLGATRPGKLDVSMHT